MKRGIEKKILLGFLTFTIVLVLCICALVGLFIRRRTVQKYEFFGTSVTEAIAARIDGDLIAQYLEKDHPDEEYDAILREIDEINEAFKCLYIYVAIPEEDAVLYIWSNGFSGEETIGYTTDYSPGGEEWMKGKFAGEPVPTLCVVKDPTFGNIATAGTVIYDSKGQPAAIAMADFDVNEISQTFAQAVGQVSLYLVLLMAIYVFIFYWYTKAKIVRPIRELTEATENITENIENDDEVRLDIHTGDELEILADSFQKMGTELKEYISDNLKITAEKERIGTELSMAARIQESMLPLEFPAFPDRDEFDLYAVMDPAKEVGGDFYDFFMIDDDHLGLVMADVSGKGVPASLFMMISKTILQEKAMNEVSTAKILADTNEAICRNNKEMMFVTVWIGILELSTGRLKAANAGHEFPVIRQPGGKYEFFEDPHGFVIGGMEGSSYTEYELNLEPGARLFVFTDGVPEAMDPDDNLFGPERLLGALNSDPDAEPEQLLKNVRASVDAFVKDAAQFDDLTMLGLHYFGPKGN